MPGPRWRVARLFDFRSSPRRPVSVLALVVAVALGGFAFGGTPAVSQTVNLGDENSWIRIQNVGEAPARIEIDFFNNAGSLVTTDSCPRSGGCEALAPGFGWTFFQQTLSELGVNYRGSAYVTSDQPFVALMARDVLRSNGDFHIGGDALRLGPGANRHVLPWVTNSSLQASRIVVQNANPNNGACVQIVYYSTGQTTPALVDPQTASSLCPSGGFYLQPNASWVRDEQSLPVPFGFDGSALVVTQPTLSGTSAANQQIQATVDTRTRNAPGLATYRSISSNEASRVVLLPLVERSRTEAGSTNTTRFRIISAQPGIPNDVTLRFTGTTPAGTEFEAETTVTVSGSRTCDQTSSGAAGCLPDGVTLPVGFSGTVRMQSVEPIGVVVQRRSTDGALSDYRGFTSEEASTQVVLPVANKNYGGSGSASGWNSWSRVLTFDGSTANVYIVYYSRQFPNGLFPNSPIQVRGSHTIRQADNRQLPSGWVGSAVIVSDRPVVVLAGLESDVFDGDPIMLYNGISLE